MIPTRLVILILVVCCATFPLHAEMIFQPKKSKFQREWREAGADLFEGIARIFNGLAALERKDMPRAHMDLHAAMQRVRRAASAYSAVSHSVTPEEKDKISMESLSAEEKNKIKQAFAESEVTPPEDERGAARIAAEESKRLEHSLQKFDEQIDKSDIKAVQELLFAIARMEWVGTNTALLIELSAQAKLK